MTQTVISAEAIDELLTAAVNVATGPSSVAYGKPYAYQHYVRREALARLLAALDAIPTLYGEEREAVRERLASIERRELANATTPEGEL